MSREITSHKVNPANDTIGIFVTDEPGAGGANHRYENWLLFRTLKRMARGVEGTHNK